MPRIFLLFLALLIAFAVFIALRSTETAASSANESWSVAYESWAIPAIEADVRRS